MAKVLVFHELSGDLLTILELPDEQLRGPQVVLVGRPPPLQGWQGGDVNEPHAVKTVHLNLQGSRILLPHHLNCEEMWCATTSDPDVLLRDPIFLPGHHAKLDREAQDGTLLDRMRRSAR